MSLTEQQLALVDVAVQRFSDRYHIGDLELDFFALLIQKTIELHKDNLFLALLLKVILDNDDALEDLYVNYHTEVESHVLALVYSQCCEAILKPTD